MVLARSANITVVGCGYVGAVAAACLADLGHNVQAIDADPARIGLLVKGRSPIREPGLTELLERGLASGRLTFSTTYPDKVATDAVFISVGTPLASDGSSDLAAVLAVATTIGPRLAGPTVFVVKSTVPVGTMDTLSKLLRSSTAVPVAFVSNPEFLREGTAVGDFVRPDRIVLGSDDESAMDLIEAIYGPLNAQVVRVDSRTAELTKYAANAFLAMKISFINEMAMISEAVGADVDAVARGIGLDRRIGPAFLAPGLGWGGSCFPKDTLALLDTAARAQVNTGLLRAIIATNDDQIPRTIEKLLEGLDGIKGRRITILGAAFKPGTDDTRASPAVALAARLISEGAVVTVYDPEVPVDRIATLAAYARIAGSLEEAAQDAEALVVATACPEFIAADLVGLAELVSRRFIVDARNCIDPARARLAGFDYRCFGRPTLEGPPIRSRVFPSAKLTHEGLSLQNPLEARQS